ncbi:MAG: hypothetical protein WBB69_10270 [Anaerolineales bacterium]
MKKTNRDLISDVESNKILSNLSDQVDLIEKAYNPDRLNLHFYDLASWDVPLFEELLSIGKQAWQIIKNYKSRETAYWFYDFFLLLSRASLSVLSDKAQDLISKEMIERLVFLLVDLSQITTVEEHLGDITKRNYEALGNMILAFSIKGDLQKLALNRANEINVPEVINFTEDTIKKVKEIKKKD